MVTNWITQNKGTTLNQKQPKGSLSPEIIVQTTEQENSLYLRDTSRVAVLTTGGQNPTTKLPPSAHKE